MTIIYNFKPMKKLYFRYSTMGAGKSLDLLKTAHNYEERKKNVFLLTSDLDNRFGKKKIASRVGISSTAVDKNIETLKGKGLLQRIGPAKGGHWEVVDSEIP